MLRTSLPSQYSWAPALEAFADKRVLVVDDSRYILRHLILMLREEGIRVVRGAEDGIEALEVHGQRPFHLILLNNYMPRMKGLDVLKELRRRGDGVPVIMHSASLCEEDVRALGLALDEFLDTLPTPSGYLPAVKRVLQSNYGRGAAAA